MSLFSCNNESFSKFKNPDTSFQIYLGKAGILRAVNTDGEGARRLQLFEADGKIVDEVIMHNEPFEISSWKNDLVEIKFLVNDLRLFKPWFETNKFKPNKIGDMTIKYSYEMATGSTIREQAAIDSFLIDRPSSKVMFFLKDSLLDEVPIESLLIYESRFVYITMNNGLTTGIDYAPNNKSLMNDFLNQMIEKE
jgi:hypothetical protein